MSKSPQRTLNTTFSTIEAVETHNARVRANRIAAKTGKRAESFQELEAMPKTAKPATGCHFCDQSVPKNGTFHVLPGTEHLVNVARPNCRAGKAPAPLRVKGQIRKGKLLSIAIFLPIRLISEMNTSEHWSKYQKRNKAQQEEVKVEWYRLTRNASLPLPCRISLTRIGQKRLDPGNLEASFKHVQDAICYCLGVDDGDGRVAFEYGQEATGRREYGVRIEVVSL